MGKPLILRAFCRAGKGPARVFHALHGPFVAVQRFLRVPDVNRQSAPGSGALACAQLLQHVPLAVQAEKRLFLLLRGGAQPLVFGDGVFHTRQRAHLLFQSLCAFGGFLNARLEMLDAVSRIQAQPHFV